MKVKSIAEFSHWSILQYFWAFCNTFDLQGAFCNTFDLHLAIIGIENQYSIFFLEWPFYTGLTLKEDQNWFSRPIIP